MEWRRTDPSKNCIFEGKPQKDCREAQKVCSTQNDCPFSQDPLSAVILPGRSKKPSIVKNIISVCFEKELICVLKVRNYVGQQHLKPQLMGILTVCAENISEVGTGSSFHHSMKICAEPVLAHITDNQHWIVIILHTRFL